VQGAVRNFIGIVTGIVVVNIGLRSLNGVLYGLDEK
jgi:hypothetical protein